MHVISFLRQLSVLQGNLQIKQITHDTYFDAFMIQTAVLKCLTYVSMFHADFDCDRANLLSDKYQEAYYETELF
jgi:hypothetical protein